MFFKGLFLLFYQPFQEEFGGKIFKEPFGFNLLGLSRKLDLGGTLNLLVASIVWGFGHISGAHINPAVSLAFLANGHINLVRALFYIACQLIGSVLAALTLVELIPTHLYTSASSKNSIINSTLLRLKRESNSTKLPGENQIFSSSVKYSNIGLTLLSDQITPLQGYLVEVLITFVLLFTIFACIDKKRNDLGGSFPLTIGFAVTVGALFGGKFTGGSMNPARSFGPAFINQNWSNHWIYWAGPITGAILAGFVYKFLSFGKKKIQKNH
ncbi:aquaporin-4 isoform X2 [Brachionus plicatilis]|uniref:Aquaporin-4 isoform X2 n=1 Tax=Brachionus plicatilis TaxID=10195 RepID=A0A3M7QIV2_BRAPC|nr:aquaporin-4 isoform X2 [Brachionus plicatilis]